jgi:hypothetical protein
VVVEEVEVGLYIYLLLVSPVAGHMLLLLVVAALMAVTAPMVEIALLMVQSQEGGVVAAHYLMVREIQEGVVEAVPEMLG